MARTVSDLGQDGGLGGLYQNGTLRRPQPGQVTTAGANSSIPKTPYDALLECLRYSALEEANVVEPEPFVSNIDTLLHHLHLPTQRRELKH